MSPQRRSTALPATAGTPTRPWTVTWAVYLMWAGAAVSLVGSVLSTMRMDAAPAAPAGAETPSPGPAAVDIALGAAVAVLVAGVWLLMAWANGRGHAWARLAATLLFSAAALFYVLGLAQQSGVLNWVVDTTHVLVGLGAVVLLWRSESSDHITARSISRDVS